MGRILNPYLVGLAAGVGSGLGEITGYVAGRGVSHLMHNKQRFDKYKDWIKENDMLAVGILALSQILYLTLQVWLWEVSE